MGQKIDKKKLIEYLQTKWKSPCPLCGVGNWNVSDGVFELREFNEGNMIIGGTPIVPVIPITCGNCGNTVLINAITARFIGTDSNK